MLWELSFGASEWVVGWFLTPKKNFNPIGQVFSYFCTPKWAILTPRMGDFGHLFALGALERGLRAVFWGVFGRFRAFSGGYRARNPREYIIMSLEGTGSVLRGSYGCLVSFCGVS